MPRGKRILVSAGEDCCLQFCSAQLVALLVPRQRPASGLLLLLLLMLFGLLRRCRRVMRRLAASVPVRPDFI